MLLVDSVEKLTEDEATKAQPFLKRLIYFTAEASLPKGARGNGWGDCKVNLRGAITEIVFGPG